LGLPPALVCVVGWNPAKEAQEARASRAAFLELRLDCTESKSVASDHRLLTKLSTFGIPIIATIRRLREWGTHPDTDEKNRRKRLVAIAESKLAAAIDVEIDASESTINDVVAACQSTSTKVIASYFNWESAPSNLELQRIIRRGTNIGSIVKICVFPRERDETLRFLEIGKRIASAPGTPPLALIAMGTLGQVSRAVGHRYGSSMIYTYTQDEPYTPGMLPIEFYRNLDSKKLLPRRLSQQDLRYLQYEFAPA
jgi:3-dehydroquinate dehydratase type I